MSSLPSAMPTRGLNLRTLVRPLALAALAVQLAATAAEPIVQWAKVVGSPGSDWPEAIALGPNGQIYLAGDISQKVLYRLDQSGTVLGTQASRGEYIRGIATDSAGNYFLTGLIRDSKRLGVGLTNDFYLAKYSSSGSLLWERTGGTPKYSNIYPWNLGGFKVAVDSEGNVIVAGGSTGPALFGGVTLPASAGGPLLCKYSPDGDLLWVKRVEGAYNGLTDGGNATDLALGPDGGIVITGFLHKPLANFGGLVMDVAGLYGGDSFIAKYSRTGDVQWVRVGYGGWGIATDAAGSVYFNGCTAGVTDMHCGKFNPTGDLVWERSIPDAYGHGVILDGTGEPVFSASLVAAVQVDEFVIPYNGLSGLFSDVLICKADATGHFKWAIAESGVASTWVEKIFCDRKGHIYVAGAIKCDESLDRNEGMLGSFSLPVLYPNLDYKPDVFIARLFDADAMIPEMKIMKTATGLALTWPVEATNYVLEMAASMPTATWNVVTNAATVGATECSVLLPIANNARFFRLRKP